MIGLFLCDLSGGALFGLVFTVLVELLPEKSASLTALDGLGENICAAVGSVIAQPIVSAVRNVGSSLFSQSFPSAMRWPFFWSDVMGLNGGAS